MRAWVLSHSLQPHGLWPTRLLCWWDFPDKNTGVGCHSLLQEIFPTQGLNLHFLHWHIDSLPLHHLGTASAIKTGFFFFFNGKCRKDKIVFPLPVHHCIHSILLWFWHTAWTTYPCCMKEENCTQAKQPRVDALYTQTWGRCNILKRSICCLWKINSHISMIQSPIQTEFAYVCWASLVAQRLKRLPAMRETWVRSLGGEDLLEKEMATHCSILAWTIPWMEEPGGLQFMGSQRVGHD